VSFGADLLLDPPRPWQSGNVMSEASGTSVPALAVTGSTGRLGGRVARRLAVRGVPQTLLARSPERAPQWPGAVAVRAEYADRNAVREAVTGTRTVLR
jgi:hypothetical protein